LIRFVHDNGIKHRFPLLQKTQTKQDIIFEGMNQYFTHYKNWEDWKNGMYRDVPKNEHTNFVNKSVECLINPEDAMLSVVIEWKEATKENLTDRKANRKSWLGQAACCYQYGSPEQCT